MSLTIQNVIDTILATIPETDIPNTRDTIKTGDPTQAVTGIVTTFLATSEVIEKTIALKANLIITHEPTFYNDRDETAWLENDPVYQAKRRLIDENNIVIWRFHDYWHRHRPDGILIGMLQALGWENHAEAERIAQITSPLTSIADYFAWHKALNHIDIPPISLLDLAKMIKAKLAIERVRLVGNLDLVCRRVALLPGSVDSRVQMGCLGQDDLDVLIIGETNEWETNEYVRDAIRFQQEKGLIILGHANSEEAGMKWCAEWLRVLLPKVNVSHVPAGDPFHFI